MYAINNVYKAILSFAGAYPNSEGYIFQNFRGKEIPFAVEGQSVVMPYDNHLQNPADKVIFHPLMESHVRGESEVCIKLRKWINVRLNFTIAIVAQSLLRLIASPELHTRLTPEQCELLYKVKEADTTSEKNWVKLLASGVKTEPDSYYVNIYLRRGGDLRGKRYGCVGITVFPFYLKLVGDKLDKIRGKDKETFRELLEFMFPEIQDKEAYNYGSQSMVAKYMHSMMMTSALVAERLNELLRLYKDYIEDAENLMFDDAWADYFDDLDALVPEIRRIPMQHGNEGSLLVQPATQTPVQTALQTQAAAPVQHFQPPQQQQQPQFQQPQVQKTASGALDFKSVLAAVPSLAMTPNPLAAAVMQQNMMQGGMGMGMAPGMNMQFPNQQQQPQATIVQTNMGPCYVGPNGQLIPVGNVPQQTLGVGMGGAPGWGDIKNLMR